MEFLSLASSPAVEIFITMSELRWRIQPFPKGGGEMLLFPCHASVHHPRQPNICLERAELLKALLFPHLLPLNVFFLDFSSAVIEDGVRISHGFISSPISLFHAGFGILSVKLSARLGCHGICSDLLHGLLGSRFGTI